MYRAPVHVQGPCCVRRRACSPAAAANKNAYTPCGVAIYHRRFCAWHACVLCCPWCGCFVCPQHLWQCASWSIVNITYSKACLILSRLSLFYLKVSRGVAGRSSQRTSGSGAAVPDIALLRLVVSNLGATPSWYRERVVNIINLICRVLSQGPQGRALWSMRATHSP